MSKIIPAILCGGSGTRLWPLSRAARPKQFHPLVTERSLLHETIERALALPGVAPKDVVLISGEALAGLVEEEMQAANVPQAQLIIEPIGKNTAPAAALASFAALAQGEDTLVLLLPSDHHVGDLDAFRETIAKGAKLAEQGFIVTFGITPNTPHTGYGYIQRGEAEGEGFRVAQFREKPDLAEAERLLALGDNDWNSGIYLFKPQLYLEELAAHEPAMRQIVQQAYESGAAKGVAFRPDPALWGQTPSNSIDKAVAERTTRAATVPADMKWSDVGGWAALWDIAEKDHKANVLMGDVVAVDVENCYVRAGGRLVALLGVSDLVVIETGDAVCIAPRERAEEVKKFVEALNKGGRKDKV